jgi:hypothetical protein
MTNEIALTPSCGPNPKNAVTFKVSSRLAESRQVSQKHAGDLPECLKNMLKLSGRPTAHIPIDTLDECPITGLPSPREEV